MALRRDFELLPDDQKFLEDYGMPWETVMDGSHWLLVHDFPMPVGYNHEKATVAIRIETGYPMTALDMVYFFPALARKDSKPINASEAIQAIGGIIYQRWSRHRTALHPWKVGEDSIGTHIFLIEDWLEREFEK